MARRNLTRYRIGTFNLEYNRDKEKVKKEVIHALQTYNLDALVVQEAADYAFQLSNIPGYGYYTNRASDRSATQVGILVKAGHTVDRVKYQSAGDGWHTVGGDFHGPVAMPHLRINKELWLEGLHAPTPSQWINGVLHAPPEREDDYLDMASIIEAWMKRRGARVGAGDWNEPPLTSGAKTPREIARDTGSRLVYPTNSKQGHGNIDYFIMRNVPKVVQCTKDTELLEHSDHNLVVATIMV